MILCAWGSLSFKALARTMIFYWRTVPDPTLNCISAAHSVLTPSNSPEHLALSASQNSLLFFRAAGRWELSLWGPQTELCWALDITVFRGLCHLLCEALRNIEEQTPSFGRSWPPKILEKSCSDLQELQNDPLLKAEWLQSSLCTMYTKYGVYMVIYNVYTVYENPMYGLGFGVWGLDQP